MSDAHLWFDENNNSISNILLRDTLPFEKRTSELRREINMCNALFGKSFLWILVLTTIIGSAGMIVCWIIFFAQLFGG